MEQLPAAVQRLLEGIESGDWEGMEQHFTPDALYDGSMPGWRVQYEGPVRIVQELREVWTGAHTWRLVERHAIRAGDNVVVDFEAHGTAPASDSEPARDERYRMANIFRLDDGRIAEHRYYCCGVWDEATVRQIEETAPKVARSGAPASVQEAR